MSSDKLFYFLFQTTPDLILRWLEDLRSHPLYASSACCSSPKATDPVAAEILGVLH